MRFARRDDAASTLIGPGWQAFSTLLDAVTTRAPRRSDGVNRRATGSTERSWRFRMRSSVTKLRAATPPTSSSRARQTKRSCRTAARKGDREEVPLRRVQAALTLRRYYAVVSAHGLGSGCHGRDDHRRGWSPAERRAARCHAGKAGHQQTRSPACAVWDGRDRLGDSVVAARRHYANLPDVRRHHACSSQPFDRIDQGLWRFPDHTPPLLHGLSKCRFTLG